MMKMLICTIDSKRRKATLRFGLEVARALSAEIMLLGVVKKDREVAELEKLLQEYARGPAEWRLPVQLRVEAGNAEDIVVDEMKSTSYELVALGALAQRRSHHKIMGSVAMRIVERAYSSVLVIKGQRPSLSRVLICASGTGFGHLPVQAGAAIACGAGARATVLHIVNALPSMYAGLEQMEETLTEFLQSDTETSRELKWATKVVRDECEISELKLRRGIVAEEILLESEEGDFDLIVLGSSRGAVGLVRALMGDVTRDILARADRPVLVVRPAD